MGSGFQVDLGQMKSLISTLSDAKDAMTSADDALKSASPQDLGSAGLDSAGGAFRDKWTYGIGKLADLAKDMTAGLQATEKAYQDVEDGIAQAFNKAAAGAGSAAGAVGAGAGAVASAATGAGAAATTVSPISDRLSGGAR
ncbi:MAG TPA: hypothetical protein VHV49_04745 [Pseudonocardiaceae bacterium]|nr:hypothetical protein [Pseudonocardiaceae bacterium]